MIQNQEQIKHVGDVVAATVTVATVTQYLPYLAALFTVVWTGMRIYEMFNGEGAIAKWWRKLKRQRKKK